jgi:hypothetical protein
MKKRIIVLSICLVFIVLLFFISPTFTHCIECDWIECRDCSFYDTIQEIINIFCCISFLIIIIIMFIDIIRAMLKKKKKKL